MQSQALSDDATLEVVESPPARPFIKWAGGKTRLLSRLLPYVPDTFADYHEPFLGGGAVYFAVRDRARGACHLSDLADELVNAWQVVRNRPAELSTVLAEYEAKDSKDFYYSVRPLMPTHPVERAGRFLYLNRTSWNGLWRVNRKGEFNVPWGDRRFKAYTSVELAAISAGIQDTDVQLRDFRDALTLPRANDFVYLDPPYLPLSDTSKFRFYTQQRFTPPDLAELADITKDLSERGVAWLLSNRDTDEVRDLFDHAEIVRFTVRRSVGAQNRRDVRPAQAGEVAIVGGPR